MKGAVVGVGLLLLVAAGGYWAYLGRQAYLHALADYVPTPHEASVASRARLADALLVSHRVGWTLADGSAQNAFYLPGQNGALIVYAHGSPGSGLDLMSEARAMQKAGYGALLIDLPGYGSSEGRRAWDEQFLESMRLAVDFAIAEAGIDPGRIGAHGYSSGGAFVARAATADPRIAALVLVASYSNLTDQLHHSFRRRVPGMGYFAIAAGRRAGVPVSELDTVAALRLIGERPILIVSGGRDQVIPVEMADLLQSASNRAEMVLFDQMDHVDFAGKMGAAYYGPLEAFWNDVLTRSP